MFKFQDLARQLKKRLSNKNLGHGNEIKKVLIAQDLISGIQTCRNFRKSPEALEKIESLVSQKSNEQIKAEGKLA